MRRRFVICGVALVGVPLLGALLYGVVEAHVQALPEARPERCAALRSDGPLYVALGDSLTHGTVSANFVQRLAERFGATLTVINGGVNSETVHSVRRRLDAVIACDPDYVTVLLGTNDANATLSATKSAHYVEKWDLPAPPSEAQFVAGFDHLLDRVSQETNARVAVVSPPLIGEDAGLPVNQTLRRYVDLAFEAARARGVDTLDVHGAQRAAIAADAEVDPAASARCARGDYPIELAVLQRVVFRRDWNRVGESFGFRYTTDCLHLTHRGADIVADVVGDWLAMR